MNNAAKVLSPYGLEPKKVDNLIQAMNWYSYEKTKKDSYEYLKKFVSSLNDKTLNDHFKNISESNIIPTYGWLARMITIGSINDESIKSRVITYIKSIEPPFKDDSPKPKDDVVKLDDTIVTLDESLGDLEWAIDDFILNGKSFDMLSYLKINEISSRKKQSFIKWADDKILEYTNVYESDDADLKEGYSNINVRKMLSYLRKIHESIQTYFNIKQSQRKPRKLKQKSPVLIAKNVKYMKEFPELMLKSIHPSEIVGAEQVWIYNTRYKKVSVYRSDHGLSIKGTTIQNFDDKNSEQRILRKPMEVITSIMDAGKVTLRKILNDLTTKKQDATGRINEDCIILRVIK